MASRRRRPCIGLNRIRNSIPSYRLARSFGADRRAASWTAAVRVPPPRDHREESGPSPVPGYPSLSQALANYVPEWHAICVEHPSNNKCGIRDMEPLIEARHIVKPFVELVANEVERFEGRTGEVHGLLGENGAGKTTLSKILYGFYQPDSAEFCVGGS